MPVRVSAEEFHISPTGRRLPGDSEAAKRRRSLAQDMVTRLVLPELLGRKDDGLFCPERKITRLPLRDGVR